MLHFTKIEVVQENEAIITVFDWVQNSKPKVGRATCFCEAWAPSALLQPPPEHVIDRSIDRVACSAEAGSHIYSHVLPPSELTISLVAISKSIH